MKKYAPHADDNVTAASCLTVASRCRADSSLVWFGDKAERDPLRNGFLKKKVALNQDDAALDQAIAEVGQTLKGAYNKNRVTVYYLLARSSANSVSSGERNAASRRPGRKSRRGSTAVLRAAEAQVQDLCRTDASYVHAPSSPGSGAAGMMTNYPGADFERLPMGS